MIRTLKPSAQELRKLAVRETDPAFAREFEPITWGPVGNAVAIACVVLIAALVTPLRILARVLERR